MRLIDADALIADLYDEKKHSAFMAPFKLCTADRVDLKFLLNEAPTVDAVTVVRCRNCKYARKLRDNFYGWDYSCKHFNTHATRANDFCSNGERKDEDEDGEIH